MTILLSEKDVVRIGDRARRRCVIVDWSLHGIDDGCCSWRSLSVCVVWVDFGAVVGCLLC